MEFMFAIDSKTKERFVIVGYEDGAFKSTENEKSFNKAITNKYMKKLSCKSAIERMESVQRDDNEELQRLFNIERAMWDKVYKLTQKIANSYVDVSDRDLDKVFANLPITKTSKRYKKSQKQAKAFHKKINSFGLSNQEIAQISKYDRKSKKLYHKHRVAAPDAMLVARITDLESLEIVYTDKEKIESYFKYHNKLDLLDFDNLLNKKDVILDSFGLYDWRIESDYETNPKIYKKWNTLDLAITTKGAVLNKAQMYFLHGESWITDEGLIFC